MFYITGDIHGAFGERFLKFDRLNPYNRDTLITLKLRKQIQKAAWMRLTD